MYQEISVVVETDEFVAFPVKTNLRGGNVVGLEQFGEQCSGVDTPCFVLRENGMDGGGGEGDGEIHAVGSVVGRGVVGGGGSEAVEGMASGEFVGVHFVWCVPGSE